jgi:hypothetical protein
MQCAIFTTIYPSKNDSLRQNLRQHRKSTALSMLFRSTAKVRIPYGVPKRKNPEVVETSGFSLFINGLRRFCAVYFLT